MSRSITRNTCENFQNITRTLVAVVGLILDQRVKEVWSTFHELTNKVKEDVMETCLIQATATFETEDGSLRGFPKMISSSQVKAVSLVV